MDNQRKLSDPIGDLRRSNVPLIQEEHHEEFTPSDDNATIKPGTMNHFQEGSNNDTIYQSFVDNNETLEMDYGIIAAETYNNNEDDSNIALEATSIDNNSIHYDLHYDSGENQIERIYDSPLISEEDSLETVLVYRDDQLDIR
ncbi:hypothetical protein B9Z55_002987 [Caenorhabditis nigoni]|uniref:Uncharacterized protein n=1 Tax=Caenorhabditis nigoni TaxID=1611254 RepID=A0A2G5VN20_9PELO|nr:hypothetical protein B9Z55_002987 [Caenorhabditis nigoni]